jgi:hypothetical protein
MDPYTGYHFFHFLGGLFILFVGILLGKAIVYRRMMRMGGGPWAYGPDGRGGCCGPRRGGATANDSQSQNQNAPPAPQTPVEKVG